MPSAARARTKLTGWHRSNIYVTGWTALPQVAASEALRKAESMQSEVRQLRQQLAEAIATAESERQRAAERHVAHIQELQRRVDEERRAMAAEAAAAAQSAAAASQSAAEAAARQHLGEVETRHVAQVGRRGRTLC